MHYLYSALLTLAAILGSPYWIYKAVKEKKYLKNIPQRLALVLPEEHRFAKPLWIHAVSVGEVLAAKPLFAALRASRPDMSIVVSTVTLTGQALAQKELAQAEEIFFFPFDWDFCVRRFLNWLHPCGVVLMETELWPNFPTLCSESEIPVFLANGPEMSNFKEIAALFLREQAARQCALEDLPAALCELLKYPRARDMLGQRATLVFRQNQGATEATVAFLLPHIN